MVYDLSRVYQIIDKRRILRNEYIRLTKYYVAEKNGTLQSCLVFCPGGNCVPSISDLCHSYALCKPCRILIRRRNRSSSESDLLCEDYMNDDSYTPRTRKKLRDINEELEAFPKVDM